MKTKTKLFVSAAVVVAGLLFFNNRNSNRCEIVNDNIDAMSTMIRIKKTDWEEAWFAGGVAEAPHWVKNKETSECMWDEWTFATDDNMKCWITYWTWVDL